MQLDYKHVGYTVFFNTDSICTGDDKQATGGTEFGLHITTIVLDLNFPNILYFYVDH